MGSSSTVHPIPSRSLFRRITTDITLDGGCDTIDSLSIGQVVLILPHFQRVQSLRGELKRTEIRSGIRFQLTTKEFILQREYRTYRIALDNILGLIECSDEELKRNAELTLVTHRFSGKPYKIVATLMHTVSPNGVVEQSRVSFYTRLSGPFASHLESLLGASG